MSRYTSANVQVSLTLALARALREAGYAITWTATGTTEPELTGRATPRATVSLVPEFPANPELLVRLREENAGDPDLLGEPIPGQIVVPALTLHLIGMPERVDELGLGHADSAWEREARIDGLAADAFEQKELADVLRTWLLGTKSPRIAAHDHEIDPLNPATLDPLDVTFASVDFRELSQENPAARYYVSALFTVRYIA